ncbi:MAG: phosphotransferase [Acidimicrobiales bacterium]
MEKTGHEWDPLLQDPFPAAEIHYHNDLSIPNTVYQNDLPTALVDWEFAAPGRRLWDLAYAVWWLVPLHRPEFIRKIGWPSVDQPRRLALSDLRWRTPWVCDAAESGTEMTKLIGDTERASPVSIGSGRLVHW